MQPITGVLIFLVLIWIWYPSKKKPKDYVKPFDSYEDYLRHKN